MPPSPSFTLEDAHAGPVCGVDEVGRGPLAGPVVAAAVIIDRARAPADILAQINDSKKIPSARREYLAAKIRTFADVAVAAIGVEEIDRLNILQATLLAMRQAVAGLGQTPALALIDGNRRPEGLPCLVQTIIRGDATSLSIAAASIIAKHYRDSLMKKLSIDFPQYGWDRNAGYGTAHHRKAIEIHGVTIHHRKSFAPVSQQIVKELSAKN